MKDYFVEYPIYNNNIFEQKFHKSTIYQRICHALQENKSIWILKAVTLTLWLSWLQTEAFFLFRISLGQRLDYFHTRRWPLEFFNSCMVLAQIWNMSLSGSLKNCPSNPKELFKHIIQIYRAEYLWPPHKAKMKVILQEYKDQGFPGCVGRINGVNWEWKNCPIHI